ncbi:MAG: ABC transporter permease, partial [Trueperaceae bacterium]
MAGPRPVPPRFGPSLWVGAALIAMVVISAATSYLWTPHDPNAMNFAVQLQGPSAAHPLGTDEFGRDLASRVLVGARGTLLVGFVAVGIALLAGGTIGLASG